MHERRSYGISQKTLGCIAHGNSVLRRRWLLCCTFGPRSRRSRDFTLPTWRPLSTGFWSRRTPQPGANVGALFHHNGSSSWLTWVRNVDTQKLGPPGHSRYDGGLVDHGRGFPGPDSKSNQFVYTTVGSSEDWFVPTCAMVFVETRRSRRISEPQHQRN